MDYKKLAADLLSGCEENCADCEYAGESEFECTIAQLAATAITDMLARAETAEARCKRLDEARENANEAAAKWEGMYHMAEARAKKAERERDAAIKELDDVAAAVDDLSDFIDEQIYPLVQYDMYTAIRENADAISMWQYESDWRGEKEE